jgi:acyl carrier protein phosphodiesterase
MNFLAHLYLSGNHPGVQIGNFIGDFVKGRQHDRFPMPVQSGILLHRQIDHFTDTHPIPRLSANKLRPHYGRYAGVVTDLFYDHYLARNWTRYSEQSLHSFVSQIHKLLIRHYFSLPREVKQFLPFLIKSRRLENYQYAEGIERALTIMANHSSLPSKTKEAMMILRHHDAELEQEFTLFFEELQQMAKQALEKLPLSDK